MDQGNSIGNGSAGDKFTDVPQISGFYGPGSILCWKLLLVSAVVTAILQPRAKSRHLLLSAESLAVVAYPAIAAGDLLLKLKRIPSVDWPAIWKLQDTGYYLSQQLFESVPNRTNEELGPLSQLLGLLVPLEVLGNYYPLSFVALAVIGFTWGKHTMEMKRVFAIVLGLPSLWCWCVILCAVSSIYEGIIFGLFAFLFLWFWTLLLIPCIALALLCLALAIHVAAWLLSAISFELASMLKEGLAVDSKYLWKQLWHLHRIFLYFLPVSVVVLMLLSFPWAMYYMCQSGIVFPSIGISLMELDQAAALSGGIITLLYSLCSALSREQIMEICGGGAIRPTKDMIKQAYRDLQEAEAYYREGYWNSPKGTLPRAAK